MGYDFSSLSHADFEDLSRDLVGREIGVRFEGFGPGPDGGIDGRHSVGGKAVILQAKHYVGSPFPSLKSAMKRERSSIDKISCRRYILTTSRSLTPANKNGLRSVIGSVLKRISDIYGPKDLNDLLRKYPEVERGHIKLWLSGSAVLERVIRSAAYAYTASSRAEIEWKVRVYAQNPSFKQARDRLEANRVLIISGPPGVGKTTLAEMLCYAYIGEEWEFVAIRSLDDGFSAIVDAKKQIFYFDDFLGKVALDTRALALKDSEIARFIKRVRRTPNARFVLTTRAYIFEEARQVSEHLGDQHLQIAKYVLDVGIYTRRVKSRILYNHLVVSGVPQGHIRALLESGKLPEIIDHKNYSPRIIEWMTDELHLTDVLAAAYPDTFLYALNNPSKIWDVAFRKHIAPRCQHLLFALFFCSEYGADIEDLRGAFDSLHPAMCNRYGRPHDAKDFEESLRILEGSFVSIAGTSISFVNPSIRDYLTEYLKDASLLSIFAATAQTVHWAESLWSYVQKIETISDNHRVQVVKAFLPLARQMKTIPVWKADRRQPHSYRWYDIYNSSRIELLLEWWKIFNSEEFLSIALEIATKPYGGFSPWSDGIKLVRLISNLKDSSERQLPAMDTLSKQLEFSLLNLIQDGMAFDDLQKVLDALYICNGQMSGGLVEAAEQAFERCIDDVDSIVADTEAESILDDYIAAMRKFAQRVDIESARIESAIFSITNRIEEIRERTIESKEPSFTGRSPREQDHFDDAAITNLFLPLLSR